MILIDNFNQVAAQIETERGISKEALIGAIEQALVAACRRKFSETAMLEAQIDSDAGSAQILLRRHIVATVVDSDVEISLDDAQEIDPTSTVGSDLVTEVTPEGFGRIAALTAKQVIIQRIREAEKKSVIEEFEKRVGTVLMGTIQRVEGRSYLVNLGRTEAILGPKDQIAGETFQAKDKVRVYLAGIDHTGRGAYLQISRTHPGMLRKLFEVEIPEIQDGIIEIMNVARESGKRAKVAVKSNNPTVGAVGTCVGQMGSRIQSIVKELGAEKVDVLEWSENPRIFIANALKPAKVSQVILLDEAEKTALVVVPNDQLSLAIGKSGINVRLSVKLTGWKLDILNEESFAKQESDILSKVRVSIVDKIKMDRKLEDQLVAENNVKLSDEAQPLSKFKDVLEEGADAEGNVKISDFAKEMGYKTKEIIEKFDEFGVGSMTTRSKLTPGEVNLFKEKMIQ